MSKFRSIGNVMAGAYLALSTMFVLMTAYPAFAAAPTSIVSQSPLSVGGDVPGNLFLVPSVEHPTVNSLANLGSYAPASPYVGYFDPDKCYRYSHDSGNEANNHFYPVGAASTHTCSGNFDWSGNFLNWAATQTIDPFRKALTGGLRVRDTTTETWLEKARSEGNASNQYYPNRSLTTASQVRDAIATDEWSAIYLRVANLGNRVHISRTNSVGSPGSGAVAATPYDGGRLRNSDSGVYWFNLRVKVCDPSVGVESNCVQYGSNYKPEGLIQQYAGRMRYSVFGYLNDSAQNRDGGVMRARQKFVGPTVLSFDTDDGWVQSSNPNREWDPNTGVLVRNPDTSDAAATSTAVGGSTPILDSGVINYINKFGQMTTDNHKGTDPVSELYYAALRYVRNLGDVPQYSSLSGASAGSARYRWADGFPVITNWDDPIQYRCQNNAFLGIGDVYTHVDKNLPGNTNTSNEPTRPATVTADPLNVREWMQKVWQMEFGTTSFPTPMPQGATQNSPYIAALSYYANTTDLRAGIEGKQTVSTYWVDVRENQVLTPPGRNQYWLATKYGGFQVPDEFEPLAPTTTALPANSWQSEETLTPNDNIVRARPKNFYVASQAQQMIESLTRAFANIVAESKGSASSLAANSTRLDTETRTFQAQFFSGIWGGELNAFSVDANGQLSANPVWRATDGLSTVNRYLTRNILAANGTGTGLVNFTTDAGGLSSTQKAQFGATEAIRTQVIDYLRGQRTSEESYTGGTLRVRDSILGDIVNSTPLFIGSPNATLHANAPYQGGADYVTWATAAARLNRAPIVYVGANDGMLHAFNANSGAEVFAFVPNAVMKGGRMAQLASPLYEHQFYVDGETTAAEIYDTTTSSWRTVLVGTLGRGGPGIFALDVTNPSTPSLLWEKDASHIPQLGRNIGRPVIAQVANGDWRVVLGNGPDSGNGAQLITIRIGGASNGEVSTFAVDSTSGNALTAVLVRDTNTDTFGDVVYAGDLEGAVWKITNFAMSPNAIKLFQAVDPDGVAQPITAAPMVARDATTGHTWVFVGTGKYLQDADISDLQVQSWYGLIDNGSLIASRNDLVKRDILVETTVAGIPARVIEEGVAGDMAGKKGWYIDLVSPGVGGEKGERIVVQNRFQGQALIGTSRIPEYTDACSPGGSGFIMAISPFTGGRLSTTFFDMNADGDSDNDDKYCHEGVCVPVSGIGFESSPNNPIFIENVMQVGLDSGETATIQTFGSAVEAARMSWRELFNN